MPRRRTFLIAASFAVLSLPLSSLAEKKYGPGVTDGEIKIGQTMPYSGPVSAYATIGRTQLAYFRMLNEKGGINGRKVRLVSLDDAYSPPKTVEQVRKLVEQEEVLALFNLIGSASNTAVIKYTNARKVPTLFIGTAADDHGDAEAHPWTIPWNPSGVLEGRQRAEWVMQMRPKGRIAILYQNDDLGKDVTRGFKLGLGEQGAKQIVAEQSYEISDPTIDSQVIALKASGADVFVFSGTPKFAAQAIRKVYELGWRPLFTINNAASSVEATLKPAGLDKSIGLIAAGYFKSDPELYMDDPAMQEYVKFMRAYYPEGNVNEGANLYGYIVAKAVEEVLRRCGDNLTRENLMQQANSLSNVSLPLLYEGVTLNTTPKNHHLITRVFMMRFDGRHWRLMEPPKVKQ
jgi:ABC-type branched-subunit amino acid transport system substrate-binding protein